MLHPEQLHDYQLRAIDHICSHQFSMLHLDPGLGKTVASLTAIQRLKWDFYTVGRVLVIAPLRVIQSVWKQEAAKWSHTKDLKFSYITGDKNSRIRGLCTDADIYLVNYDNLVWLQAEVEYRFLERGIAPPWNMAVMDEITKLKGTRIQQGVKRGQAMLKLLQYCPWRVGLTGSPAPNGMLDLFGQYLCVDAGQSLGHSFTHYQSTYFYRADFHGRQWLPFERSKEQITDLIAPITIDMRARDYINMPDEIENDIWLDFPPDLQAQYDNIEREMLIELESGESVEIFNRASLTNRCLQFAGGAVFLNPGLPDWEKIHEVKLEALQELVEELNYQPVLVMYQYRHEAERIQKMYPHSKWLSSKVSASDFNQAINDWNTGKLNMIVAHAASLGHGVDRLQTNCHNIIWYGMPWSWELYYQSNSRIARQGQTAPTVMEHRILVNNTVDEVVSQAVHMKRSDETEIRDLIKAYGERKKVSSVTLSGVEK